ncbi:immunoglobulin-like domain-containing protein [Enterococcus hirae]|nr:BspA family leucine-rich repeat surface protein [Enterococcus hirae]EMF0157981.1 BspA family leucine-rich repeat surface protein [Enterococcus hirae]
MSKKKLTAKRKKQLLTMFAVAGVMGNAGIAPTMALADTLTPTAETATEQTQANEAKEVIDQTIQNVTDPLVNPTDSTTTASDSLATTEEATDETTDDTQDQATAPTAESEEDATNPTAEAPKVAQTANVATTSEITGTWGTSPYTFDENTGVLTIEAGELSGYEESPWNSDKVVSESIKKIVLAGKVVAPEDSSNLFSYSYLKNVTEIDGLSQLDTSNVTDMREMFRGMNSITSLDLSGFDTSKVTTMGSMFKNTPLAKLTLGDHFKAVGDTGLSAPKALNEGDQLTGNWIREDGQSKGYSPADFMTNYGTGDLTAGTYVAELVKSELKPQEYHVGDVNITGTYTGDMSLGRLTVNGKVVSWGGSFKDGQFSYYVGAGKLKVGDKVVLDGYNKEKELIDSKEIEVISESSGSIDQVDTYKLGDSTITGTYTGDIHKGKLVVNGEVISWGGTYKDGKFSYYVNSQIIKAGDQATIQGYDKFDTPLGDPQPVTIGEQLGQLTEAHRVGISTVIEGNYTGDVYQGILLVNGEKVSQGGSFKDGKFSYYVGNLKVSEDDQVVLMGANNRGQQIPGSEIGVTIQTPTAEINELTYKLGTQTIKGAYGSDTQVHQGHLFVNGKLISKGGSFKDGAISYYVKPDLIKADDQVTMNFYDGSGNLLAENQTVSVN